MDTLRTSKISRLIQKELGEMFLLDTKKVKGVMVSVTEVRVTPDLGLAKVYLSIFPDENADVLMKGIQERASTVRYDLGKRMGGQLRKIPELVFYRDRTLDYAERIDELLGKNSTEQED